MNKLNKLQFMKKIVEVKCSLENAAFVVNNIIPPDKHIKDLILTLPVEILDCADTYKFLSSSEYVLDWKFESDPETAWKDYVEEDKDIPEKEIEPEIEKSKDVKFLEEIKVTENEYTLYSFIYTAQRMFINCPSIKVFSKSWKAIFINDYSCKRITITPEILDLCRKLLKIGKDYIQNDLKQFCDLIYSILSKKLVEDNFAYTMELLVLSLIDENYEEKDKV